MALINTLITKGAGLADDLTRYVRACGERSILETKPIAKVDTCGLKLLRNSSIDFFESSENLFFSKIFGRNLNLTSNTRRQFNSAALKLPTKYVGEFHMMDASSFAMNITNKARGLARAKISPVVARNIKDKPHLVQLDETESISKKLLDEAFKKVRPNGCYSMEYRGAVLNKSDPLYTQLINLKKGDVHIEPGYIWTSPNSGYAFGRYAEKSVTSYTPQASVRYNILMTDKSKMLCVDRANPETLLEYNSKHKVHDIIIDANGNIELFLENLV